MFGSGGRIRQILEHALEQATALKKQEDCQCNFDEKAQERLESLISDLNMILDTESAVERAVKEIEYAV